MYVSYFTSMVTPEVKVEWDSDLRPEWSLEMGVEWSSDLKSRVEQCSNLEVGWNLEQQKCEMGRPLTAHISCIFHMTNAKCLFLISQEHAKAPLVD